VIVEKSRMYMMGRMMQYDECSSVVGILKRLCAQSLKFGERDPNKKIFSRPFGVSILIAAFEDAPKLYLLEPSGSYKQFRAKSIGSAYQAVDNELLERYDEQMSHDDTVRLSYTLLKEVMRDKISKENVETMVVDKDGVRFLSEDEISNYLVSVS
ncbi:20S proteasome, regulatory subunit alpha type PSMA5/PUP2, partial [Trachipleistophora hominis]